MTTRVLEFKV